MLFSEFEKKVHSFADRFSAIVALGIGAGVVQQALGNPAFTPFMAASVGVVASAVSYPLAYMGGMRLGEIRVSRKMDREKEKEIDGYLNNDGYVLFKMDRGTNYGHSFYENAQGVVLSNWDRKTGKGITCDISSSSDFRSWQISSKGERYFAVPKGSSVKVFCNGSSDPADRELVASFTLNGMTDNQFRYVLHAVDRMRYNDLREGHNIEYSDTVVRKEETKTVSVGRGTETRGRLKRRADRSRGNDGVSDGMRM